MTSDAKVGLLLGLIFIFVIAFIINGLPNLKTPQAGKAEVTTNMVSLTEENFDVAGQTPRAQRDFDWTEALDEPPADADEQTTMVAVDEPQPAVETPPSPQEPEPTTARETRMVMQLPDFQDVLGHLAAGLQRNQGGTINMDVPGPAPEPQIAPERQGPVEIVRPKPAMSVAESVRRALSNRQTSRENTRPTATPGRVYVVEEGDNLGSIAKKVYGSERGNRVANINQIYEANKRVMKSPHEVFVGQKLVIPPPLPPLPTSPQSADASKPANVLPSGTFEPVKEVGGRRPAVVPARSFTGQWYTVVDGDSLWKIASSRLGSGVRSEELSKLNADILNGGNMLQVGMKLRLPPK